MSDGSAALAAVPGSVLARLRDEIARGAVEPPLSASGLASLGVRPHDERLMAALGGHGRLACLGILDAVLAERSRQQRPAPELVWTGPEGTAATARDTAIVLRQLFESARRSVLLAGYSFLNAEHVLRPLHDAMATRAVRATFFIDIEQVQRGVDPVAHLERQLRAFRSDNWPFGPPYPRIFHDPRALVPGPPFSSMHAKCVVVDEARAFLSSANFTTRGQERNIEAGVLLDDPLFAEHLARQWLSLVDSRHMLEWKG